MPYNALKENISNYLWLSAFGKCKVINKIGQVIVNYYPCDIRDFIDIF